MVSMVDYDQASRREILKALSAAGVSGASLRMLSDDVLAETHDDEIPYVRAVRVKNPDKAYKTPEETPPKKKKVHRRVKWSEWARVRAPHIGEKKLKAKIEELSGTNGLVGAGVSNGHVQVTHNTYVTHDGEVIEAPEISKEELEEKLPREVDVTVQYGEREREFHGIPVEVKAGETTADHNCGNGDYTYKYRPVPGGVSGEYDEGRCSIATPAYKNGRVILGAGHCTYDYEGTEQSSDGVGDVAFQPRYNVDYPRIGEVSQVKCFLNDSNYSKYIDGAVIDLDSDVDATSQMGGPQLTYDETITGWLTFDDLAFMEDYNQDLYRQGKNGGRCSGEVTHTSSSDHLVRMAGEGEGGDSGGTIFAKDGDYVDIAAIYHGSGWGDSFGYVIEDFINRFNITSVP